MVMTSVPLCLSDFYPRPPRGGRLKDFHVTTADTLFLSTPSARRATVYKPAGAVAFAISIHALREEGDIAALSWSTPSWGFLSTPSARRATKDLLNIFGLEVDFYPRPPRGGRRPRRRNR